MRSENRRAHPGGRTTTASVVVHALVLATVALALVTMGAPSSSTAAQANAPARMSVAQDARYLHVVEPAHTHSWNRASRSVSLLAQPPIGKQVFIMGDSLTVGTESWLPDVFAGSGWKLDGVDARVGRGTREGLSLLSARANRLPSTVIVALGTNNLGATTADVESWLREARRIVGNRRLIWVNLCLDDSRSTRLTFYRRINRSLEQYAGRYDVEIADWCGYSLAHGVSTVSDGVHYDATGYRSRAQFYIATLTRRVLDDSFDEEVEGP